MSMNTNLHGRLRNTSLPASSGLMPLFEAVVNSIHAIEELGLPMNAGRIVVTILRDNQRSLRIESDHPEDASVLKEPIIGFRIVDNGVGFTDDNMNSFRTLDSEHKMKKGGRGVGRLLWLKAFDRVVVESVFEHSNGKKLKRAFAFDAAQGVRDEVLEEIVAEGERQTSVQLVGFQKRYREASLKTARSIANSLFEHCLWYFVREGSAPEIKVVDGGETISLADVYDGHMASSAITESVRIKNRDFSLTHIRLGATSRPHAIALCAASRLVREESLSGKIPGLYGKLEDGDSQFVYLCYVASDFLDEVVRSERTGFDISEEPTELFSDDDISLSDIRCAVTQRAAAHLAGYLDRNIEKSRLRVETFVSQKAPRYRPILSRISEEKLGIDPSVTDKDLELALHKQLAEIELELLADGQEIMSPRPGEAQADYKKRVSDYLKTAEDIKKSDLANYVFHRKVILDLLGKAIQKDGAGKYAREELIHSLIMPMQTDSNQVSPDDCNLWLLDERLAFHDYLASDRSLSAMPITGSKEAKEPDLCALNVYDNPILFAAGEKLPLASIVIVEIKRPMRNDAAEGEEKDPVEQALDYLNRIRQGKVTTASGRQIPESDRIPGFCYVICDITPTVKKRCEMHDAVCTSDKMGYFFYHKTYDAYVEVVSFDRMVNAAQERNRAFFDKLGLPAT